MKKTIVKLFPAATAIILFIFLQLPLSNLGVNLRDEGFLLYNAEQISSGKVPYKDFFLTTTPGLYYVHAFLLKFSRELFLIDRISYIVVICLIILLSYRLFIFGLFPRYFDSLFLFSLSLIFIGAGNFLFYNHEALLFIIISLILFKKFRAKKDIKLLFLAGISSGLTFLFKQSYGIYNIFGLLILLLFCFKKENKRHYFVAYLSAVAIILILFFGYFYLKDALPEVLYYIFIFAKSVKAHRDPFILTTFILSPIYILFVNLLQKFSFKKRLITLFLGGGSFFLLYILISPARLGRIPIYIKDPLVFLYLVALLFPLTIIGLLLKDPSLKKRELIANSIIVLSVFFASASSGRDYTTLVVLSPFLIPLFLRFVLFLKIRILGNIFILPAVFIVLYTLLVNNTIISPSSNVYGIYKKNDMVKTTSLPELNLIKVSNQQKNELEFIISYIKQNVSKRDTILCFPYCPMIYFLSRINSASYFSFFYPETFMTKDQDRVIAEIKINKPKLIIMQKRGELEPYADSEDKRLSVLRTFIIEHCEPIVSTKNFVILSRCLYE